MTEPAAFLCLRFIVKKNGTGTSRVLWRGNQDECQFVADGEPPDMDVVPSDVAGMYFKVIDEAEWNAILDEADLLFPGDTRYEAVPPEWITIPGHAR